jgi:hypothetical protein
LANRVIARTIFSCVRFVAHQHSYDKL